MYSLYPGAGYVDWTCLDAYNHGTPWTDFASLVSRTYSTIQRFAPNKPMLIGETGSVEDPTDSSAKADWIRALFSELSNNFSCDSRTALVRKHGRERRGLADRELPAVDRRI